MSDYPWTFAVPGQVFGHETMGYVADVGRNVKGFKIGDRVTGLGGGGYKEYIVMEPQKTMHIPENIKDEDAIVEPIGCLIVMEFYKRVIQAYINYENCGDMPATH